MAITFWSIIVMILIVLSIIVILRAPTERVQDRKKELRAKVINQENRVKDLENGEEEK